MSLACAWRVFAARLLANPAPQTRPFPAERLPPDSGAGPLDSVTAAAYRPAMSRLVNCLPPNPRLQRTSSASPPSLLSRKTFGDMPET